MKKEFDPKHHNQILTEVLSYQVLIANPCYAWEPTY